MDEKYLPKALLNYKEEKHKRTGRPRQNGEMKSIENGTGLKQKQEKKNICIKKAKAIPVTGRGGP
jgi:hypothetical protein